MQVYSSLRAPSAEHLETPTKKFIAVPYGIWI